MSVTLNVLVIFVIALIVFLLLMAASHLMSKNHIDNLKKDLKKDEPKEESRSEPLPIDKQEDTKDRQESTEVDDQVVPEEPESADLAEPSLTQYPAFDHSIAIEQFGLQESEVNEFISDLIAQIDGEIPALTASIDSGDYSDIRRISHLLKGSSLSLGSGGVTDAISALDHSAIADENIQKLQQHLADIKYYLEELKKSYL